MLIRKVVAAWLTGLVGVWMVGSAGAQVPGAAAPVSVPQLPAVAGGAGALLSDLQREELVSSHNRWRIRVGVPPLRWSAEVAANAQNWARFLALDNRCKMKHSDSEDGENVFWAGALHWSDGRVELNPITGTEVANSWGDESKFYSIATDTCEPGKVCGHYTQVVWSETQELGCGRQVCADKSQIWVCQYRPAGNIIGQKPY